MMKQPVANPKIRMFVDNLGMIKFSCSNKVKFRCPLCGFTETAEAGKVITLPLAIEPGTRDSIDIEIFTFES